MDMSQNAMIDSDETLGSSFDIVTRQDATDQAVTALRGDVAEVKMRLDRVSRAARPVLDGGVGGGTAGASDRSPELKGFVDGYLRQGRETEMKSLSGAVASDGGYSVPRQIDEMIALRLKSVSPIRSVAQVVQTGTAGYRKLINVGGTSSGWVSETAVRPNTNTPSFAEIAPPYGELYANPAASQSMLDDAMFDVENWLADEISREFARAEGAAFVNGTGVNQPIGFLTGATSTANDAARTFGTLQYIATGNATGLGTTPELKLIDLMHQLKAGHRQGGAWVMNSATLAEVRKLKDSTGAFLWQPAWSPDSPTCCSATRWSRRRTCPISPPMPSRSRSVTSTPAT